MCKFLSDSILQGALVAPAEVPSYKGLLALVQYRMEDYNGDLTSIVNPTLKLLGYKELEHSILFDSIAAEDIIITSNATIRLPEFDNTDPSLELIATLLGYEKLYTKCYLSKINRILDIPKFYKILKLIVEGILLRLESLTGKVGILSNNIIDLLCMHYVSMIMEISLLWHINLFKELFPAIIPIFSRQSLSSSWIEEALHNYRIIECCNSIKKFIQERYTFSLQKVSEDKIENLHGTLKTSIKEALGLYGNLFKLLTGTTDPLIIDELLSCISIMENYLYFAYSDQSIPTGKWINIFSDNQLCLSIAANLENSLYSPHILSQGTARGAFENIHAFLNKECFTFINACNYDIVSIPRLLKKYLVERQTIYASIYHSNLNPVYKEKNGSLTENLYVKYSFDMCNNIRSAMEYLSKVHSREYMLEEKELIKLKTYFSEFCKFGYVKIMSNDKKIKVNNKKLYCLYGFFCSIIGTTDNGTTDCFNFLESTIQGFKIRKESNFKKGRSAYIETYKEHLDKNITPFI